MQSTIFALFSDDSQKSFKNELFQKGVKIYRKQKSKCLAFFKSTRSGCHQLHFKSIKKALKIIFPPKQSIFAFLT